MMKIHGVLIKYSYIFSDKTVKFDGGVMKNVYLRHY